MGAAKVSIREVDLTTRVPGFDGVYGAIVIPAKRGPVDEPQLITGETDLLRKYTPGQKMEIGFDSSYYSAMAFLQKSDKLWVMRAIGTGALYAGATIGDVDSEMVSVVGMADPLAFDFGAVTEETALIYAADPGDWANSDQNNAVGVKVWVQRNSEEINLDSLLDSANMIDLDIFQVTQEFVDGEPVEVSAIDYDHDSDEYTDKIPSTLPVGLTSGAVYYVISTDSILPDHGIKLATTQENAMNGIAIDITAPGEGLMKIRPIYGDIKEPNADALIEVYQATNENLVLESFYVSFTEGTFDGYGANIYIEDALEASEYVRALYNVEGGTTVICRPSILWLDGGLDYSAPNAVNDADMMTAANHFRNSGDKPITTFMDGGWTTVSYQKHITAICEYRKDCIATLSTRYIDEAASDYMNRITDYVKNQLNVGSSYAAIYTPHVKITCKDTKRTIYVPPDGYAAAAISYTAYNYEMWYPVAGFKRGVLSVDDVRRKFSMGQMDYLYDENINPIRFFPGKGVVIWGQVWLSLIVISR